MDPQHCLQDADRLITEQHYRPSNSFLDLGFKNLPHFPTAFEKTEFGATPNNLDKQNCQSSKPTHQ